MVGDALENGPDLLDGKVASEILLPVVEHAGGTLVQCAVTGVRHNPGRRLVVRYRADVDWRGIRSVETAVLMLARRLPDGVAIVEHAGTRVGAWLYPHDPHLPGLASAASSQAVGDLVSSLGGADGPVRIVPRVYRPLSRAVIAVEGPAPIYLKVVKPTLAQDLHDRHERLSARLPVPRVHGFSASQGIVVLEARTGEELGAALSAGRRVPSADEVLDLLDAIADSGAADRPASTPAHSAQTYSGSLASILPTRAAEIAELAEWAASGPYEPDRTVHGDFYEAQLLVADGSVTALLDIDRMRWGDAADDPAVLLAHLDVLAWARPTSAARIRRYRDEIAAAVARRQELDAVTRRACVVLLGLAAWPFRAQLAGWESKTDELVDLAAARARQVR